MNITPQNVLIGLLISLGVIFLGVAFSDGVCVLQLVGLCENNESLTFKGCIAQLLGSYEDNKHKTLTFLGIGMGGVLVALQALASHKRAKAMEDAANAQAKATKEQAKANQNTEQGQRQERLKNAIEHLGHKSVSVRLGGAYELFHLAADATEDTKKLRQTVLDILCAHIRQTTGESEYREKYKSKPSEEIQSLLSLLFVQEYEVFKGLRVDLQGSWLNGADLDGAHLEQAVLSSAYLQRAKLNSSYLREANLTEAYLTAASLLKADLRETVLLNARLQGVCLHEARLQGARLDGVQMQGAELMGAQMQSAYLDGVQMQGAELVGARLQKAVLIRAQMQGTLLMGTKFQGAMLDMAQLQGANLSDAEFHEASLHNAQLQGVFCNGISSAPFEERIRNRIGQNSDLSRVIFAGGLHQDELDIAVEGLSDQVAESLRFFLQRHVDEDARHEPLEKHRVATGAIGAYTEEEAEQWITEYNETTKYIKD